VREARRAGGCERACAREGESERVALQSGQRRGGGGSSRRVRGQAAALAAGAPKLRVAGFNLLERAQDDLALPVVGQLARGLHRGLHGPSVACCAALRVRVRGAGAEDQESGEQYEGFHHGHCLLF